MECLSCTNALRDCFAPVTGKTGPSILVRAKVFEKGASEFQGLILGGRALDCEANGGLGFRPVAHGHVLETLGIVMPRVEQVDPRPDKAYAFQLTTVSAFDSDEEQTMEAEPTESTRFAASTASCGIPSPSGMPAGDFLLFDGDPVVLEPGEGALVPVLRCRGDLPCGGKPAQEAVFQICDDLDVVPGLWEAGASAGVVFIANVHQLDLELDRGKVVALVSSVVAQTRVCTVCKHIDSEAWQLEGSEPTCECGAVLPGGASACRNCGGHTAVFSYSGCSSCGFKCAETPTTVGSVYHIVEEPGAIDRIVDVLSPPETYYEQLRADMAVRHPDADRHVLDRQSPSARHERKSVGPRGQQDRVRSRRQQSRSDLEISAFEGKASHSAVSRLDQLVETVFGQGLQYLCQKARCIHETWSCVSSWRPRRRR